MRKLKRVVIKEELVALTGKVDYAIVLNQFIFWSERVKDVDKYLKEEQERERKFSDGSVESEEDIRENLSNGWIYKTAAEMKEECMFEKSETTMERIMKALVEKGWLDRRRNPKYKWDKTYQYRVNLLKIQRDLLELGYALEGYSLGFDDEESKVQNADSNHQSEGSRLQNEESKVQNADSNLQNEGAIPKTTTEITSETTFSSSSRESIDSELREKYPNVPFEDMKNTLLNDETAVIDTDKQYKALLEYRLKHWKPKQEKTASSKGTSKQKPIRTEKLPEWFDKEKEKQETPKEEIERNKREIEEMLKKLRS